MDAVDLGSLCGFPSTSKSSKELRLRAKGTLECRLANAKFSDSNQVLARKSGFCLLQDLCDLIKVLVNWL